MKKEMRYLVPGDYMADPAVHVFNDRVYIYPSHDWESGIGENDNGDHFNMKDYHVFSTDDIMNGEIKDHGVVLPMKGSYSIDPAVFDNGDGDFYIYFGGLWGGQLQRYRDNKALECAVLPEGDEQALPARVAKLSKDMLEFAEEPKALIILDENGKPLTAGDNGRRFFEASWMHKYNGKYYFSYSTGDTHRLCYAIGDNPYGPFTYQGVILTPVVGWTTHHAIVEYKGKWYLFHHDCVPSNGKTWLRSLKVCELEYDADGKIITIDGQ